jgi:hypothetical protein
MRFFKHFFGATAALWLATTAAAAEPFTVVINTTPLSGTSGFIVFDFLDGSPGTNELVVNRFSTNGTLNAGQALGSTTGSLLSGPLRLNTTTNFFNQWSQAITFGTNIRFDFTSTSLSGVIPDNFSLYLLPSTQVPFATTDPTGANAAISMDVTASSTPQVYASAFFTVSVRPNIFANGFEAP